MFKSERKESDEKGSKRHARSFTEFFESSVATTHPRSDAAGAKKLKSRVDLLERTIRAVRNFYASKTLRSQMDSFNNMDHLAVDIIPKTHSQSYSLPIRKHKEVAEKELLRIWGTPRVVDISAQTTSQNNTTFVPVLYRVCQLKQLEHKIHTMPTFECESIATPVTSTFDTLNEPITRYAEEED
ncbi:hypothetical protein RFI_08354 [Reticulomyxa filosa]|uniref:Uncharacterized protein n=1 Tax=Reticulomyxa filosa TaxID=46433 RepID=X6NS60_RETFI|nr:hypothetical protein RFI_08354 [Reticulomyxa filosa]|eukprot:ETO28773.1 hypothetical protein RFI_08354 [Reticulomyxa filosa]